MSLLDKLNPIKAILDTVRGGIDDLHTSEEEKLEAKHALRLVETELDIAVLEFDKELVRASADVLKAEIAGKSWLQRSWRPILMLSFTGIIINNYILLPYIPGVQPLDFPQAFWGLLTVGVGGYIGARTYEKKLDLEHGHTKNH